MTMTCSNKQTNLQTVSEQVIVIDTVYSVYDNDLLRQTDKQTVSMIVTCSRKTNKPRDSVYGNDLLRQTDRQTDSVYDNANDLFRRTDTQRVSLDLLKTERQTYSVYDNDLLRQTDRQCV